MARGRGIYKRGKIWWIQYAGPEGEDRRESSRSTQYSDARELLDRRRREVEKARRVGATWKVNHTFADLEREYSEWAKRQRAYPSKKYLIASLKDEFGFLPLKQLNTMLVEQYQTQKLNEGYKPSTVNRLLATLKHMMTKALDWRMLTAEVAEGIRRVCFLEENSRRLRYLSTDECQELIEACGPHLRPIVITALNSGMRKGEILSLKWDNVDLKHGFILLDRTKNGDRREIPLNDTLKTMLENHIRHISSQYVFCDLKTGKPYLDVKKAFQTALRRSKIHDFRFHDLRHTFASHLVMAGVDLTTVKELLGHKTLTMTLRYAHLAPAHKMKAVGVLDRALNRPTVQIQYNQKKKGSAVNG